MTLLMFNGFEGYSTPADQKDAGDGISSFEETAAMEYTTGRNGGKALRNKTTVWNRAVYIKFPAITNDKIAICGCAVYFSQYRTLTNPSFIRFSTSPNDGVIIKASGSDFVVTANSFSAKASVNYPYNLNQWYYIECKVKCHDTNGIAIVNINEQEVLNYSGDLHYSGDTFINTFGIKMATNGQNLVDDIYVADNQGTENNDFLGDIRVDSIRPNGAGNYSQFTPSVGNNYECVDESELDESDYVGHLTVGEKDSYTYGSVPTDLDDAGIIALQIKNNAKRTATADNIKIDNFIRTGSTDYSQTVLSLSDDFTMVEGDMILDDPSDSNIWTQAKINACEFGMEVG